MSAQKNETKQIVLRKLTGAIQYVLWLYLVFMIFLMPVIRYFITDEIASLINATIGFYAIPRSIDSNFLFKLAGVFINVYGAFMIYSFLFKKCTDIIPDKKHHVSALIAIHVSSAWFSAFLGLAWATIALLTARIEGGNALLYVLIWAQYMICFSLLLSSVWNSEWMIRPDKYSLYLDGRYSECCLHWLEPHTINSPLTIFRIAVACLGLISAFYPLHS